MSLGGQPSFRIVGGGGISRDFNRLDASGRVSVTCRNAPFRLNYSTSFIPLRSSRILRQVSPQTCSAIRSSSRTITVSAIWAWMRCTAWWCTGNPSRITPRPITTYGASERPFFDLPRLRSLGPAPPSPTPESSAPRLPHRSRSAATSCHRTPSSTSRLNRSARR